MTFAQLPDDQAPRPRPPLVCCAGCGRDTRSPAGLCRACDFPPPARPGDDTCDPYHGRTDRDDL